MSKFIFPVIIIGLLFSISSCEEQPILLNHASEGVDSTYITTPENPQPKKILATEMTGVTCPNCPQGAAMLEQLNEQNQDAVITVSMHSGVLTEPIEKENIKSKYDFRTEDGLGILNQIFGGDPGLKPVVSYNRLPMGTNSTKSKYFIESYSQNWGPKLQIALTKENPVLINVYINSSFNSNTDKYDIQAKVVYNQEVSGKQRLNIFLTQDSIIDVQQTTNFSDPFNEDYVFMHAFRKAVTGISGQPVLDSLSTKKAGRVYIFNTSIKLNAPEHQNWIPKNMHVIAFVSQESPDDIHVYQTAATTLE